MPSRADQTGQPLPSPETQDPAPIRDPDEAPRERHRTRVNLIAAVFITLFIAFAIWVVKLFHDQEQLQRCLDSRRNNCFDLNEAPREGLRLPAH